MDDVKDQIIGNILEVNSDFFKVPHYQRRFSWKNSNWEAFWNDLAELEGDDKHYLGSIVIISGTHTPGPVKDELELVDGQQRIVTLSIFLCAIRDYFERKGESNKKETLEKKFLYNTDKENKKVLPKLKLGNLDSRDYKNVLESNFDVEIKDEKVNNIDIEFENKEIKNCYKFFRERIETLDSEKVDEFYDALTNQLMAVFVTVKKEADAYKIFETLNNRGLDLSPVDLIKNHLFRVCNERSLDINDMQDYWADLIGNLDKLNKVRFFRQYMMSSELLSEENDEVTEANIESKVSKSKLHEEFKSIVEQTPNLEEFVRDIVKQSSLYGKLRNQNIDMFDRNYNRRIEKLLEDLEKISKTPFTFLLRAFREVKDPQVIIDSIGIITPLMVRRSACGLTTAPHDKIYHHLAQNAFKKEDSIEYIKNYIKKNDYYPSDETFKKSFRGKDFWNNDKTRYYLSTIEEEIFGAGTKKVIKDTYKLNIEHILPNRHSPALEKNWLKPYNISKEEHKEYRKKIGNLTLLRADWNISAGQRTLDKKQEKYKKEEIEITRKLVDKEKWGIKDIEKRSEELAEHAVNIWRI